MAENHRPTGFPEKPFQQNFVQTQSENHEPVADQYNQEGELDNEAMTPLKKFQDFSDVSEIMDNNQDSNVRRESAKKSNGWLEVEKCDRDSCQSLGIIQDTPKNNLRAGAGSPTASPTGCQPQGKRQKSPENNLRAGAGSPTASPPGYQPQGKRQNSPENNLRGGAGSPTASPTGYQPQGKRQNSPENNLRAGAGSPTASPTGYQPQGTRTMNENLEENLEQTKLKLVVNKKKINGTEVPKTAAVILENRKNICPSKINNTNDLTPNIQMANQTTTKLVKKCSRETLEYLNDGLLPIYETNWQNIASRWGWNYEKIHQFHYKNKKSGFRKMIFQREFSSYTVQNLLDDLTHLDRRDLLNDYPHIWN